MKQTYTPTFREFATTRRKAEDSDDRAGAVCELVTAVAFNLRRIEDDPPARHYYRCTHSRKGGATQ